MAKKVIKKVTSKKSKLVENKPVDKKEVVEIVLKDTVQYIKVYPKYNPLRK
jgi:hypothetical protein|tara:strand:- start:184 stop:336 length:153 start_codon:yes stop_codon:yes gene_type:complete